MSVYTYKCPNCDGGLLFSPETQAFTCEYCTSSFSKEEIEKAGAREEHAPQPDTAEKPDGGTPVLYSCPSCGAEVAADETTAATYCYYCHNPVVLSGRLDGAFKPHAIIPFSVSRERAVEAFMAWTRKKWFVPKYFFAPKQVEMLSGVYFPYWLVDCRAKGSYSAKATKVRIWRTGNTQYTETRFYDIKREGTLDFNDMPKNALNKENSKLINGIHPYKTEEAVAFSPAYLSGFQAEKRNIEAQTLESEVARDVEDYTKTLLRETVNGYNTVTVTNSSAKQTRSDWKYTLLPAWVLTYKGSDNKVYFYALNGQTGTVSGVLPVDYLKLGLVSGAIALGVTALVLLGGALL